ncbi:PIN2/TERF1-interacting telomerase inhibitor 1 isoform X2 [Paroedura picta]
MLEKMGWSKGKGLGAQEQGKTEHIRVRVKNNTLGLGTSINHEDNWIAHQDDFNQLLADLNNCHGQEGAEPASGEQKKRFNLEEKSKFSRKRVHYVKFAKGKDLSSRSEDDLSCIFGKRQKSKETLAEGADADSPGEDPKEGNDPPEQVDTSNTTTSTLTVQEYFAKRMAKLKKAQNGGDTMSPGPPPAVAEEKEHLGFPSKKKKSRKHGVPENEGSHEEPKLKCHRMLDSSEEVGEPNTEVPKKKKKSKHLGLGGSPTSSQSQQGLQESGSCFTGTSSVENSDSEVPKPKKKTKKKHKKLGRDTAEDVERDSRRKKKKKRSS